MLPFRNSAEESVRSGEWSWIRRQVLAGRRVHPGGETFILLFFARTGALPFDLLVRAVLFP